MDIILAKARMDNGAVIGSELVSKLSGLTEPTRQEHRFLIKTMGNRSQKQCGIYLLVLSSACSTDSWEESTTVVT